MDPNTDIDPESLPFVLRGLGYYRETNQSHEGSKPENPHDTSHLHMRNHRIVVNRFKRIYPGPSEKASAQEAAPPEMTGSNFQDLRKASAVNEGAASMEDSGVGYMFRELQELSDEECISHYNRILGGDFHWDKLNRFVQSGRQQGGLEADDVEEWNEIYQHYLNHKEPIVGNAENIERIRSLVQDILLWAVALDYWFNYDEIDDIIEAFQKPYLTTLFGWDDSIFVIQMIHCRLYGMIPSEGAAGNV